MRMMVKGEILEIQDDYAVRMMEQGQAVPAPYAPEPKERIAASAPEEPPRNDNEGDKERIAASEDEATDCHVGADAPPRNDNGEEDEERIAALAPEDPPRNDNDGAEKPAEETPEAPKAKPRGKRKG